MRRNRQQSRGKTVAHIGATTKDCRCCGRSSETIFFHARKANSFTSRCHNACSVCNWTETHSDAFSNNNSAAEPSTAGFQQTANGHFGDSVSCSTKSDQERESI